MAGPADGSQLNITWRQLPTELRTAVQLNKKKNTITIKAKKSALDYCKALLCMYWGPPIELSAAGGFKAVKSAPPAAPPGKGASAALPRAATVHDPAARNDDVAVALAAVDWLLL